jgi:hypothetical protein
MTLEEALAELDGAAGVLIYQDAKSGKVQVVQRHPNGRISLIDPTSQRIRASHAGT